MELIRFEDVTKRYRRGEIDVPVLYGISLSIARGEFVALMGASGSGKTTLMNILGCLDRPTSGRYWLDGQELSGLSRNQRAVIRTEKIGFVFQTFNLLRRTTAMGNVVLPLDYALRRPASRDAQRRGLPLLEHVGLADRVGHEPSQMSGGQQQRVAIARALINRPMLVLADEPTGNLDSQTSVEILRMFEQLNAEGITVVLVTHDPNVAAVAHRTIHIRDGQIDGFSLPATGREPSLMRREVCWTDLTPENVAGDTVRDGAGAIAVAERARAARPSAAGDDAIGDPLSGRSARSLHGGAKLQLLPRTLRTALHALRLNKMRSALTALGVIIGVGAVIAMMEIGAGSKAAVEKTIASMGANALTIHSGAAASGGISHGLGSVMTLTPQDAEAILAQCPSVAEVAPLVRVRFQAVHGNRNWSPSQLCGTSPAFLVVRDWEDFSEGEMFTDRDVRNAANVCVIGETLRRELFAGESPIGKDIRIQSANLKVVGVLSRKGANMMGMDQDDVLLAPWTTIKYRVSSTTAASQATTSETSSVNTLDNLYPGSTALYAARSAAEAANTPQLIRFANVDHMYAKAVSAEEIPVAIEEITALLRERHHIRPDQADDFYVNDMAEASKALASISELMGTLLLVVALISLVVGGVGIMNIMLVSVTERTREIGLRMAVGARDFHILRQFLVEAVMLSLLGGAAGIALGRGVSVLVRSIMQWPTQPSVMAMIAAAAVSVTVGVVFGFYPAWKASRLDPIEALRYE